MDELLTNSFDFNIFMDRELSINTPMASLSGKNRLIFNAAASKLLAGEFVEIGYSEEKEAIAIQLSEKADLSKKLTGRKECNQKSLTCTKLVEFIGKKVKGKRKFPCQWDEKEKALIFYLGEEGEE